MKMWSPILLKKKIISVPVDKYNDENNANK